MAAPVFAAPHPAAVLRVLKQARREYIASGNALGCDINAVANQLATAPTTVAGVVYRDPGVPAHPVTVSVQLFAGATLKATQSAPVNPGTGAYTTTFPASTLTAGAAHATVSALPALTAHSSNTFGVT